MIKIQKNKLKVYCEHWVLFSVNSKLFFHSMPYSHTVAVRLSLREDLFMAVLTTDTPMRQRSNLFCPSHHIFTLLLFSGFKIINVCCWNADIISNYHTTAGNSKVTLRVELHWKKKSLPLTFEEYQPKYQLWVIILQLMIDFQNHPLRWHWKR